MSSCCYPALELSSSWTQEGDSPGAHGTCPITPGTPTTPMRVLFTPAKRPQGENYDNVYILHRNAAQAATKWAYVVSATFPSQQDIHDCRCFELDFQQNNGSTIFNLGWQARFGTGWMIWNRSAHTWVGPVLPAGTELFTPGVPKRIVVLFSHDNDNVTYLGIGIDGVWTPAQVAFPAVPRSQTSYVNNAIQLDSQGQGAPIACWFNECNLLGF